MTTVNVTASQATRRALLESLSALEGATWFQWPTATAALDSGHGVVLVATEPAPAPDDWDAVVTLLELAGFDNGTDGPWRTDPGEPQELAGLATWSLSVGIPVA